MSSLQSVFSLCGGLALTYLMHSTCLLLLAWFVTRIVHSRFHAFHSLAWKCATLAGIATSLLALTSSTTSDLSLGWSLVGELQSPPSLRRSCNSPVESAPTISLSDSLPGNPLSHPVTIQPNSAEKEAVDISTIDSKLASEVESHTVDGEPIVPVASTIRWQSPQWKTLMNLVAVIAFSLGVLGLVRFAMRWKAYCRLMASCQPGSRRAIRLVQQLRNRCHRPVSVRVLVNSRATQPFATGLVHWKIVLPPDLANELEDDELYALLAHEFGHLQRGDIIWQWVGEFVCSGLAIQPLNFVARRGWQGASEFLADQWSCEQGRASPLSLAKCLSLVAERTSVRSEITQLSSAFAQNSGNQLVNRVDQLLRVIPNGALPPSSGWKTRFATVAAYVVIGIVAGFAPNCIPSIGMAAEVESSRIASHSAMQWSEVELDLNGLQIELLQLVELLQTQQRSPAVLKIARELEIRNTTLTERADAISREINKREYQR